jgi:hypothetical protein
MFSQIPRIVPSLATEDSLIVPTLVIWASGYLIEPRLQIVKRPFLLLRQEIVTVCNVRRGEIVNILNKLTRNKPRQGIR